MQKKLENILKHILWTTAFLVVSFLIGEVTQKNIPWYETLEKSPLTPPRLAFPIVWTILYIMLANSGCLLWSKIKNNNGAKNLGIFIAYMLINWSWSFIFFSGHFIMTGFFWILISDVLLAILIISLFKTKQKLEMALLIPTLIWSIFAAYLNGYIAF